MTATELFGPLSPEDLLKTPPRFFLSGDVALAQTPHRVAIIGRREASAEGLRRAAKLARQLVERGIVIVSGLAKGIDRAAHEAAMDVGGRTIAVIGTPVDKAYPAEHADLQERIYREHLLVSQFAIGQRVFPTNFPARNRTMARLSHASVIVEAGDTSGSLSQAAETVRLGRQLFILRSVLDDPKLTWPAKFIGKGAEVLDDVQQVLSGLH